MSRQKILFLLWAGALVFFTDRLSAQAAVITLVNPSFEDEPRHSKPPLGWYFCGQPGETPPDIHPTGVYGVEQVAVSGQTYAGMVVRDNHTWEALGQHLTMPMVADQCYALAIHLCRSANYTSISRSDNQLTDFTTPIRLRVWGGEYNCQRDQLLAVSEPVSYDDWQQATLYLQPQRPFRHLILEAFYADEHNQSQNGNILIDELSPLVPVDCSSRAPLRELPLVAIPEIASHTDWHDLIRREAPGIRFTINNADVERQYFRTAEGPTVQENLHLYRIAKTLGTPGRTLLVVVNSGSNSMAEHRAAILTRAFRQLELTENEVKVRTFRSRDKKIKWTAVNTTEELFFLAE